MYHLRPYNSTGTMCQVQPVGVEANKCRFFLLFVYICLINCCKTSYQEGRIGIILIGLSLQKTTTYISIRFSSFVWVGRISGSFCIWSLVRCGPSYLKFFLSMQYKKNSKCNFHKMLLYICPLVKPSTSWNVMNI